MKAGIFSLSVIFGTNGEKKVILQDLAGFNGPNRMELEFDAKNEFEKETMKQAHVPLAALTSRDLAGQFVQIAVMNLRLIFKKYIEYSKFFLYIFFNLSSH